VIAGICGHVAHVTGDQFAKCLLTLTAAFPKPETIRLVSANASLRGIRSGQYRPRIPAAEPNRDSPVNVAESSLEETRYFLILAQDLGYGDNAR
jgi:hypothetical protein